MSGALVKFLAFVGGHARLIIALGPFAAIFLGDLSAMLRPMLPVLVAVIYATAMMRVDMRGALVQAMAPRAVVASLVLCVVLLVVSPFAYFAVGHALGLRASAIEALVYTGVGPPIASAAALCLIIGADAVLALRLTIVAALLAPFTGPVIATVLLGEAVELAAYDLALRIAAMLAAGALAAALLRLWLGPALIARNKAPLDGIAAIVMVLFVIPLFDGALDLIQADPSLALETLGLVFAVNVGVQVLVFLALVSFVGRPIATALGLCWGNRNAALYLAALPPDPAFSLYVALYQIPMYLTAWLWQRLLPGPIEAVAPKDR